MKLLSIAWRNILRNRRRTVFTLAAVAVSATAMLLLGGYVKATVRALETDTVRQVGHLQIMAKGFLEFGRGNAGRFALRDHEAIAAALRADPVLQSLLVTATPVLQVQGVVGNYAEGTSTNFAGSGWDPQARSLMLEWDGNHMRLPPGAVFISEDKPHAGVIGAGLAQLLGLCEVLAVKDCVPVHQATVDASTPVMASDLAQLTQRAMEPVRAEPAEQAVSVELMSSGATGAPNVVRMEVLRAQRQGAREFDAMFIGMPLALAQRLLFGPQGKGASAVVLQLKDSGDIERAKARVQAVLGTHATPLEVHDFHTIQPNFDQVVAMFTAIFRFVTVLMAVVTLFTVANTINMAVNERIGEIGSLRAIGFTQGHVRGMFLIEGALIGAIGAGVGALSAIGLGEYVINRSGLRWTPPGRSAAVPIAVDILGNPAFIATAIVLFALLACASSWWPARRASRLEIVEALRHV